MTVVWYAERFESADEQLQYVFPRAMYEYESAGALRLAHSVVSGVSYAFDHLGGTIAQRDVARESVRFVAADIEAEVINAEIRLARTQLLRIGRGKLWLKGDLDGAPDTQLWAWARLAEMPQMTVTYNRRRVVPISLGFDRFSDWYGEDLITPTTETVTSSPDTFTINNPGELAAVNVVIRLRSNSAAGFTNPKIENLTNGYILESTRDAASSNSELRFDTERGAVEFSTDNGINYTDDFANLVIQAVPYKFPPVAFLLEPGNNQIRATIAGTANVDIEFSFYPVFP